MAPRIELRPLSTGDAAVILRWRTSGRARPYTAAVPLISPDGPDARGGDKPTRCWIVVADRRAVGLASLVEIDRHHQRTMLAWCLAEPGLDGLGIDTFVEYWLVEYAIEGLRFAKVSCETPADDEPAWRLHEAFGFRAEARLRGHREAAGERIDVLGLGLLAADWRERRPAIRRRLKLRGYEPPPVR